MNFVDNPQAAHLEARPDPIPPAPAAGEADRLLAEIDLRAKPLIVTIFGDSIRPEGGGVWLSTLIRLAAPFGLSERVVRTAVFRLRREGWLSARRVGRRSFYTLTADARRQFETAENRIYAIPPDTWDGTWSLVILDPGINADEREHLIRELRWAGFAPFASNVLAYPARSPEIPAAVIEETGLADRVLRLEGGTLPGVSPESVRRIIERNWQLDEVRDGYDTFIKRFSPSLDVLTASSKVTGEDAFRIRTLLIDDYRRILLKDPALPLPLLPESWPRRAAAMLARDIYRDVGDRAQAYVRNLLAQDGVSTETTAPFFARFGGL